MPEDILVRHCAPTLAGLKTGSLFSCAYPSEETLHRDVREWNRRMVPKGVRVLPLRYQNGRALIYIYRPEKLCNDLSHPVAAKLLSERGYPCDNADRCVCCLMGRIKENRNFPHEIGLFLGYPPVDVHGFIHIGPKKCKCVGDWKVYGDEQEAQKRFALYRKCTNLYSAQLSKGKTVEQLTVPS